MSNYLFFRCKSEPILFWKSKSQNLQCIFFYFERKNYTFEWDFQRILGIIGITAELASTKYNLVEIEKIIDNTCVSLLKRIIDDESHPLTSKLNRVSSKSKSICRITNNKIRTKAYENSFVQKYLRTLRNGSSDLYTTRSNPIIKAARRPPKTLDSLPDAKAVKTTVTCPTCGKLCKSGAGIKAHIRLSHTNSS